MAGRDLIEIVAVALANGGSVDDERGAAEAVLDALARNQQVVDDWLEHLARSEVTS